MKMDEAQNGAQELMNESRSYVGCNIRKFDPFQSLEEMTEVFTYHAPDNSQIRQYAAIRAGALVLAEQFMGIPPCADRTAALRLLREAVMTANAAVALRGRM